jgi:hypothetical protein
MIEDRLGITIDFNEWYNLKEKNESEFPSQDPLLAGVVDWDGLMWLNQQIKFAGFMSGPVAVFHGAPVQAQTRILKNNPKEFVNYCKSTENHIFLYDMIFLPSRPEYYTLDPKTFKQVWNDEPVVTPMGKWKVRYGELAVTE